MKILLTGMTRMQANRTRRREYNTSIRALYEALLQAKHKVEWRPLEYGEKLSKYDRVILGLGTISEFSCSYLYEALMATAYDKMIYLVNDWKANATIRLLEHGELFREFVMRNNTGKRLDPAKIKKDARRLETLRKQMFDGKKVLGPFFKWGDRQIIFGTTPFQPSQICEFDPSAFYLNLPEWSDIEVYKPKERARRWVYGALADYTRWDRKLENEWPIVRFNKKTFIPENDLVREWYATSWGMLLPHYQASGSGWWRARYCHAVLCENVMYGDASELDALQALTGVHGDSIRDIEDYPMKGLIKLAKAQANELREQMTPWKETVENVHAIVGGR